MTLKKTKEIIGSYLEKVKVSPEKDPEIQEITREFQKKGYKWLEQKVTYAGIKQRWLIVESAERKQSEIQKLNSKIDPEKKTALKLRKKLKTTGFDTVTQAQNYLKSINKKLNLWELKSLEIKSKKTNKHSDIINSIVSTLSGFLTKKLSAKNCGSMINLKPRSIWVFIIPEYF